MSSLSNKSETVPLAKRDNTLLRRRYPIGVKTWHNHYCSAFDSSHFSEVSSVSQFLSPRWILGILGALLASTAFAADNPNVWEPKVKSVAVFKNGYGFFVREGDVKLRDGWAVGSHLPPAVLSTLALYAHDEADLVDVIGTGPGETVDFDGKDAPKTPAAIRSRLEASKGLQVQLGYTAKGIDRTAAGELISVGPEYVVLEHDGSTFAVPVEGVKRLHILNLPIRVHVAREKDNDKPVKLGMAYLRKGIVWIPEYSVKILDDTTAEIMLRGTLVNEAEDLIHTDVQFVVGVPHFLHGDYLEPASIGQVIRTIGASVMPEGLQTQVMNRAGIANNTIQANQFDARRAPPGAVDKPVDLGGKDVKAAAGNLPTLDSSGAGSDFTVYTKSDLTLRIGEKAIVTLFRKKVKYAHRYRWEPPAELTHSIMLFNDTDSAFTTGPFVAVSGSRPLAQDLLKYTPIGGQTELPITAAVNVATDREESEIDRKIKALTDANRAHHFDLVTLQGNLKVRNFEKRAIDIVVSVKVPGKPLSGSDGGIVSTNAEKLVLTEREGRISWKMTVEPGGVKQVEYKYERYVPTP